MPGIPDAHRGRRDTRCVTFIRVVAVVIQRITGSLTAHFRDKPIESPMRAETVTQKRFCAELEIGIIAETAQIFSHTLYHLPDLFGIRAFDGADFDFIGNRSF